MVLMVRLLLRQEHHSTPRGIALPSVFSDALASIATWIAFAGLLAAAFYQFGLVLMLAMAIAVPLAARFLPVPALMGWLAPLKFPLALGALVTAAAMLFGAIEHFEGAYYG